MMKGAVRFMTAVVAVLVLTTGPAHAVDETKEYVTTLGRFTLNIAAANRGLGGYIFAAGTKPLSIKVVDGGGNGAPFTVCQELPGAETEPGCGNGDDVSQDFCSNGSFQTLNSAFVPNINVAVFIGDPTAPCSGLATTGTVTLRR